MPRRNGGDTNHPRYALVAGMRDTVLRKVTVATPTGPVTQPLFMVPPPNSASPVQPHPYQQSQLLQKIYNNVTTTSNVFAIWLTVGFFEVQDTDSAGNAIVPPKIGSEIGRDQNTQIRHRMFAIVDRSAVSLFGWNNVTSSYNVSLAGAVNVAPGKAYTSASATLNTANSGTTLANGSTWTVQPGMLLEIGIPGVQSEVVTVTATVPPTGGYTFTANFTMSWPAGTPVVCRGNPGPYLTSPPPPAMQYLYNHRTDPAVLHYSIIQ